MWILLVNSILNSEVFIRMHCILIKEGGGARLHLLQHCFEARESTREVQGSTNFGLLLYSFVKGDTSEVRTPEVSLFTLQSNTNHRCLLGYQIVESDFQLSSQFPWILYFLYIDLNDEDIFCQNIHAQHLFSLYYKVQMGSVPGFLQPNQTDSISVAKFVEDDLD